VQLTKKTAQGTMTLREDMKNGKLVFDADGACGAYKFVNVAEVLEPGSANPGLKLNGASGLNGIRVMLDLIEQWREHVGLEPSVGAPAR